MPKGSKLLLLAGAAALAVSAFSTNASAQQTVILKMAHWLPPVHHFTETAAAWIKSIGEVSGGKVKIQMDKSALAKPPGQYDLAKNGVRDIAWGVGAYTPGRSPLFRLAEIPFASPNAEIGSEAHNRWYTKHGFDKKELNDVVMLTSFVHGPGLLHSKKEIKTLEDIKGVKIRVGGGGVFMAKSLGAVPVNLSATQAHESLQRGTTDAAFFPWEAVHGFRLAKLVKYHLEVPGGLYTTPFFIVMNKKKFAGLPPSARKALRKAGGTAGAKLIGRHWDEADKVGRQDAVNAGNKIQTITSAEQKRWAKEIAVIEGNWIKKANSLGHDGKALVKDLRAMMKGGS